MESGETSLLEYAAVPPPPIFDPPRASRDESLLGRHDLSHTDSKSFVALFSQGLGNATVSTGTDVAILENMASAHMLSSCISHSRT